MLSTRAGHSTVAVTTETTRLDQPRERQPTTVQAIPNETSHSQPTTSPGDAPSGTNVRRTGTARAAVSSAAATADRHSSTARDRTLTRFVPPRPITKPHAVTAVTAASHHVDSRDNAGTDIVSRC